MFPNIQPEHPLVQREAVISPPTEAPGLSSIQQWLGITFPRGITARALWRPISTNSQDLDLSTATFSASNKTINPIIIQPHQDHTSTPQLSQGAQPTTPSPAACTTLTQMHPRAGTATGGRGKMGGSGASSAHTEHLPSASCHTASSHVHTACSYGSGNGEGKVCPWIEKKSAFVHQVFAPTASCKKTTAN